MPEEKKCSILLSFLRYVSVLFIGIFQVLSHNLCTVLSIPHDPVALEEHFRDDDDGPVSSQGYMPYLNKYILDKVIISQLYAPFLTLSRMLQSLPDVVAGYWRILY